MSELADARAAWSCELIRLAPEILRDPVASAVVHMAVEIFGLYNAEIARLKAELDERHGHNVVHFQENVNHPAWRATDPAISELIKVMYADEPDGTILRATDTGREWVKENGEWVRQP